MSKKETEQVSTLSKEEIIKLISEAPIEKIPLKEIKFAPYNPKKFNQKQFNLLGKSVDEYGFIYPILINKRTGIVIDGNQRTKYALKKHSLDFLMTAKVIDVDEHIEKALNIALNETLTPSEKDMVFNILEDLISTQNEFLKSVMKDYEKNTATLEEVNLHSEYQIVQEPDESYDYIFALFSKSIDFLNVCNFFDLKEVYDVTRNKKIGLGRGIKGEDLLKLINLAHEKGINSIKDIK